MKLAKTALLFMLASATVGAQVNEGEQKSDSQPALHHDAGDDL